MLTKKTPKRSKSTKDLNRFDRVIIEFFMKTETKPPAKKISLRKAS